MGAALGGDMITVTTSVPTGARDRLNIPILEPTSIPVYGCSVDRLSESEFDNTVFDRTTTLRKVYAPTPAPIPGTTNTFDLTTLPATATVAYLGQTYNVFGDVDPETNLDGTINHVTMIIRRTAG